MRADGLCGRICQQDRRCSLTTPRRSSGTRRSEGGQVAFPESRLTVRMLFQPKSIESKWRRSYRMRGAFDEV